MDLNLNKKIIIAEQKLTEEFRKAESISLYNQNKVLQAFQKNKIASNHFNGSTGYGDGDCGREKLNSLFADVFKGEDALVSPHILCGTHAITITLFGLLSKGDLMLSVAGSPYDTLYKTINGTNLQSLKDIGVKFKQIELKNGNLDFETIIKNIKKEKPKVVYLQRSKGYAFRNSISINQMEELFKQVKQTSTKSIIIVDNCYGEFTERKEPIEVGADVIVGSLTKNAGGGLAPNGGYIVGNKNLIEKISYRFTSPSLGNRVGSYEMGYRMFFQGLFLAPEIVFQAVKGLMLSREIFSEKYDVFPRKTDIISDIVLAIKTNNKEELNEICNEIQHNSPIDSFVNLEPWNMPGYQDKVIMASGSFIEGATLELSCDAPMREPFIAFLQGGLSYNHVKIALNNYLNKKEISTI